MNLRRGHSRRLVAAIAATAMCGAGLAMGAGVAQADLLIAPNGPGETIPYSPETFPTVYILPEGVVSSDSKFTALDHEGWMWAQFDHEQTTWMRDSGAAQALRDSGVLPLRYIGGSFQGPTEEYMATGGCISLAVNPATLPAALAGDASVPVTTRWNYNPTYC